MQADPSADFPQTPSELQNAEEQSEVCVQLVPSAPVTQTSCSKLHCPTAQSEAMLQKPPSWDLSSHVNNKHAPERQSVEELQLAPFGEPVGVGVLELLVEDVVDEVVEICVLDDAELH